MSANSTLARIQREGNGTMDAVISIQIPESAEPGDELSFVVEGRELTIPVPPSSQPGDILQIKLGERISSATKGDDGGDEGASNAIRLVTGNTIVRETSHSTSQHEESCGNNGLSDGTHTCIWPASRCVIDFMNSKDFGRMIQHDAPKIRSVLELGAGHGVFGMAFADIVASFISSPDIIIQVALTDVQDALDQLKRNIDRNCDNLDGRLQFTAISLAWHSIPLSVTNYSIDFILGSDLLYNCCKIPELVATVRRLLSTTTRILFSVRWRKPLEERAFFVALSDLIRWEMICGRCPLGFEDYGNPVCEESNRWFTQTLIGCEGKTIPLSSIDEDTQSRMTDVEFEEYERLQTQIYLGTAFGTESKCTGPKAKRHKI